MTVTPHNTVLLLSGGLDSVTLLYDLVHQKCNVHCLLAWYGQRHERELQFARRHVRTLALQSTEIVLPQLRGSALTDNSGSVVVPMRNATFIAFGVNLAAALHADSVTLACNQDDQAAFPDCRMDFLSAMNRAVEYSGLSVEVCYPYSDKTKREIVERARQIGAPYRDSWSCYAGGESECGVCLACKKRTEAVA